MRNIKFEMIFNRFLEALETVFLEFRKKIIKTYVVEYQTLKQILT